MAVGFFCFVSVFVSYLEKKLDIEFLCELFAELVLLFNKFEATILN